ncbi:MAG: hypothetical protein CMN31_17225 [Sandaracinus sp.]|nr:hypothetical protein [Myxococcales bacterium]MBJ73054.1 hypothetical protein [Sandaracinus sp.]
MDAAVARIWHTRRPCAASLLPSPSSPPSAAPTTAASRSPEASRSRTPPGPPLASTSSSGRTWSRRTWPIETRASSRATAASAPTPRGSRSSRSG